MRCVFYYVGKAFCIRGGQEQRDLKPSQFLREYSPDRYTYEENGSKNHTGHFSSSGNHNKVVTSLSMLRLIIHHQSALSTYLISTFRNSLNLDFFYLKPLQQAPKNAEAAWFQATPIGRNTLAKFVQMMCDEAGIEEKKSNHSLRASGATAMFAANVPEKMIKEVTGHKSSKALAIYERPTVQQKQAVSNILVTSSKSYLDEVKKLRVPTEWPRRHHHSLPQPFLIL